MSGCTKSDREKVKQDAKATGDAVQKTASDAADASKKAASDAAEKTKSAVSDAADKTKAATSDAVDATKKMSSDAGRMGSGIPYSVPRGTYRCADDKWVALSTSAESVASRVMALVGLGDDPRLATFAGRVEHRDEVDHVVRDWIAARPSG